jgi:uncharacterized protein YbjT (DUF2867 family)
VPARVRVVLFGASGVAGSEVLRACLAEARVVGVRAVVRKPLDLSAPRLRQVHCENFKDLSPIAADLAGVDACFYCLGVSQTQVPDEDSYREITYAYALEAARTLKDQSPEAVFHFLSGAGTNAKSRMMWARIKGETEVALREVGLGGVVCWRPGYIHSAAAPLNRQLGERALRVAYPLLRPFRGLTIEGVDFGRAMVQAALDGRSDGVLENKDIRELIR